MISIVYILDRTMLALVHTLCSTCHKLNNSFVCVQVFQVTGINCKCFTVSRLGVSEFSIVPKLTFKSRVCFRGFVTE